MVRLIAALAGLALALAVSQSEAGAGTGICCVCECPSVGTTCTTALGPGFCDQFFAAGCGLSQAPCGGNTVGSACDDIPACAAATAPAPAPAAGVAALAASVVALALLAAGQMRRQRRAR